MGAAGAHAGRWRVWLAIAVSLIAILALPWLVTELRQLGWNVGLAREALGIAQGDRGSLDVSLEEVVPVPAGYSVIGVTDFRDGGGSSAVIGLTAPGSMAQVSHEYAIRMGEVGWRRISTDEASLTMYFDLESRGLDAYVIFREYVPGTISLVVQVHEVEL